MKKNRLFLFFLLCTVIACTTEKESDSVNVDFEKSCGKGSSEWHSMMANAGNKKRLALLQEQYERVLPKMLTIACEEAKIPKRIHQIWLGPKPLPGYFWAYQKSWQEQHPDWEYTLWTDKEVEALDFDLKALYLRSTNYGEKSDILRAELLDRFGGLYVDIDCECIQPFEKLHEQYDFYAGIEPPHQGDYTSQAPHLVISDAIVGAASNHPIIKEWKRLISLRWDDIEKKYPDSPKRVLMRTFYPFGEAASALLKDDKRVNIVFPPTYFYPLTFSHVSKGRIKKMGAVKQTLRSIVSLFRSTEEPFAELQPETMAVHYWGNSWVKSNEERFREMYQQILCLNAQVEALKAEVEKLKQNEQVC